MMPNYWLLFIALGPQFRYHLLYLLLRPHDLKLNALYGPVCMLCNKLKPKHFCPTVILIHEIFLKNFQFNPNQESVKYFY